MAGGQEWVGSTVSHARINQFRKMYARTRSRVFVNGLYSFVLQQTISESLSTFTVGISICFWGNQNPQLDVQFKGVQPYFCTVILFAIPCL